MVKINIWLTSCSGKELSIDLTALVKNFKWETEHLPLVGDTVSIDLESLGHLDWADGIGWIDGKVIEREFEAQTSTVELTLEIERTVAGRLSRILGSLKNDSKTKP